MYNNISSCITDLEIGCAILQEFIFPEGLSVPLGGEGAAHYVVIEMHYDNPLLVDGKFYCNCMHACMHTKSTYCIMYCSLLKLYKSNHTYRACAACTAVILHPTIRLQSFI